MLTAGATIGILGGGQLGQMLALAAQPLGLRTIIFTPEPDSPASQVAEQTIVADYTDIAALNKFAALCDVITFEFENIPLASAELLAAQKPFYPQPPVLAITQDRIAEKQFVNDCGIATAPWHAVHDAASLHAAIEQLGLPLILKTTRMGYDGKGQRKVSSAGEAEAVLKALGNHLIAEGIVNFKRELSVIIARNAGGEMACFPLTENIHRNHILYQSLAPAQAHNELQQQARLIAEQLVSQLNLVGLIAIELFETADGQLLVNELAPRPHNSGHWTIEGAATSQFTQLLQAVTRMPLGDAAATHQTVMTNLLGDEITLYRQNTNLQAGTYFHDYGKTEIKTGRKMGHVTIIKPLI